MGTAIVWFFAVVVGLLLAFNAKRKMTRIVAWVCVVALLILLVLALQQQDHESIHLMM